MKGQTIEGLADVDQALRIMQACDECRPKAQEVIEQAGRGLGGFHDVYPCHWCQKAFDRWKGQRVQ